MPKSKHGNLTFLKRDLMIKDSFFDELTDSISCLHALEHFGLGRYGDPINPDGHLIGLKNIIKMLKIDGTLLVSTYIRLSRSSGFNSQRTFSPPSEVVAWSKKVSLKRFDFVDDSGSINFLADLNLLPKSIMVAESYIQKGNSLMKILTGSSGLIGSEVVRYFSREGHQIHGVDNNMRAQFLVPREILDGIKKLESELSNFIHHEIDIRNRSAADDLIKTIKPDLIIHTAAQPSHDRAAAIPFDDFDTNAVGT